ncbi:MAG: extracellular solute-binding protein, partial [Mycobacteriaceae bacterium]
MLNWYVFNPGASIFTDAAAACSQQSNGAYRITVNYLPAGADGQRQQLVRRLAADDTALDILGLDVTWTPEFAEAKWIEPWPADEAKKITDGTLDAMVKTATWKDRLYSAPFNTNTQLLWYRKDLVPTPPKTWAEMIAMSEKLAKDGKAHLVETQGAQYEGFTVWFNTMVASAGGQILSKDGSKAELGPAALEALKTMKTFATSIAADPSFSNQMEDDNRLAFESGSAAFELNYPFIYPSAQTNVPDLFKNLAWTTYPRLKADEPAHVTI